jgi:hypothetical protein
LAELDAAVSQVQPALSAMGSSLMGAADTVAAQPVPEIIPIAPIAGCLPGVWTHLSAIISAVGHIFGF